MQGNDTRHLDFFSRFYFIFTLEVIFVSVLGAWQGDDAIMYSSFYQLGNKGLSFTTLLQLGITAITISTLIQIFLCARIFERWLLVYRVMGLLLSIVIVMIIFIIVFEWFSVDFLPGWIGFLLSFGICFLGSTAGMLIRTRKEGRKYEELLETYKKKNHDNSVEEEQTK